MTDPRAAQIEAAAAVLAKHTTIPNGTQRELLGRLLVDAVHAAGRDGQGEAPDWERRLIEAQQQRADQVRAETWAKAVQTLLDTAAYKRWHQQVYATTGVDHHRWNWNNRVTLADYREAVGPDGTVDGGDRG